MINKKNIYSLEKTKKFFQEHPIILIYQHNNLTVKQHIDLKVQLQQLNNVKTFTVKNSIVERVYFSFLQSKKEIEIYDNYTEKNQIYNSIKITGNKKDINNYVNQESCFLHSKNQHTMYQLQNLLQGPVFLIGCYNVEEFKNIWGILKTSPSFLFVGGQFNNQIYTHLDIQKSLEINHNIYYDFLNILDQLLNFQNSLLYNNLFGVLNPEFFKFKNKN